MIIIPFISKLYIFKFGSYHNRIRSDSRNIGLSNLSLDILYNSKYYAAWERSHNIERRSLHQCSPANSSSLWLILSSFLGALLSLFKQLNFQFIICVAGRTTFRIVCRPIAQVRSTAVDILINLITFPETSFQKVILPIKLIIYQSCPSRSYLVEIFLLVNDKLSALTQVKKVKY